MSDVRAAERWTRADLHVHTSFSGWRSLRVLDAQDCYVSPDAAFTAARARRMDFVCFTDHDTIAGALDFLSRRPEEESRVIVGEEVEARFPGSPDWIHVNVLDVDEELHADIVRLRGDGMALLAELRRRGCFFVLNHPFQSFRSIGAARRRLSQVLPLCPAVEVCNGTSPRSHVGVLEALLGHAGGERVVRVGGSDAHTLQGIASVHTAAPGATKREYLASLRSGTCAILGRPRGVAALIGDVYAIVGEYYARLYGEPAPRSSRWRRSFTVASALLPAVALGVPAAITACQALRQEYIARFGPWARGLRTPEALGVLSFEDTR